MCVCVYLAKSGIKIERQEPQSNEAVSVDATSGDCNMATILGRHSSRTPLRNDGRMRPRTEWNGNSDD